MEGRQQHHERSRVESPSDFWSRPDLVDAYSIGEALAYEVDLIAAAVEQASRTGPVRSVTVLGVGAGRELGAVTTIAEGAAVDAWDISHAMVQRCQEHVEARGWHDVTVHHGAITEIPTDRHGSSDVVVALGAVFGYATTEEERRATFRAAAALLRPGGTLAAIVQQRHGRPDWSIYFTARALADRITRRPVAANRLSRHGHAAVEFHHYSRRELRDLALRAGFADLEITSLRQWARVRSLAIRKRSPNPLLLTAQVTSPMTSIPRRT